VIGCTPFEAGHGLQATTIAQARLQATRLETTAEGGRDGDALEDVDAFFVRPGRAWAIVVACKPCLASNGVQPIAELNVMFRANWKAGSAMLFNCSYSWSVSFLIIDPMDALVNTLTYRIPSGVMPTCSNLVYFLRYSQIADTAPVRDDNSGALSVRNVLGTPLWNIMSLSMV
jgi:hypothetical protein